MQSRTPDVVSFASTSPVVHKTDISHLIASRLKQQRDSELFSYQSRLHEAVNARHPLHTPLLRFCLRPNDHRPNPISSDPYSSTLVNESDLNTTQKKMELNNSSTHGASFMSYQHSNNSLHNNSAASLTSSVTNHASHMKMLFKRQPTYSPPLQYVNLKHDNTIKPECVVTSITRQHLNHNKTVGAGIKFSNNEQSLTRHNSSTNMSTQGPKTPINFSAHNTSTSLKPENVSILKQPKSETKIIVSQAPPQTSPQLRRVHIVEPNDLRSMTFLQRITKHEKVIKWIESLDITLYETSNLTSNDTNSIAKECIEALKNGTKLAEIIEKLEGRTIPGIDRKPARTAGAYNNVNRVLSILRERKNIDPTYLWSVKEILAGDEEVIWGILQAIYEEYGKIYKMRRAVTAKSTGAKTSLQKQRVAHQNNR